MEVALWVAAAGALLMLVVTARCDLEIGEISPPLTYLSAAIFGALLLVPVVAVTLVALIIPVGKEPS